MKTYVLIPMLLIAFCAGIVNVSGAQFDRPVRFTNVYVEGNHTVNFTQTNKNRGSVSWQVIEAYESYADVYVRDGMLVVKWKEGLPIPENARIIVDVAAPHLNSLIIRGEGEFQIHGKFYNQSLSVSIDGYGSFNAGKLRSTTFTSEITGGGTIEVNALKTEIAKARVRGEGEIYLMGRTRQAAFDIVGEGSVFYDGLKLKKLSYNKSPGED